MIGAHRVTGSARCAVSDAPRVGPDVTSKLTTEGKRVPVPRRMDEIDGDVLSEIRNGAAVNSTTI